MAWLAVDKDGNELLFIGKKPVRWRDEWVLDEDDTEDAYILTKGIIEKLSGIKLTWEDEPLELK